MRAALPRLLLAATWAARAYDTGEDVTLCWVRADGFASPVRESCAGSTIYFLDPPSSVASLTTTAIVYELAVPTARMPNRTVPHLNIHTCSRVVGFCTPFLEETPGLVTQSPALMGLLGPSESIPILERNASLSYVAVRAVSDLALPVGDYTLIAHAWWVDETGMRHEVARAFLLDVYQGITTGVPSRLTSYTVAPPCIFTAPDFFLLYCLPQLHLPPPLLLLHRTLLPASWACTKDSQQVFAPLLYAYPSPCYLPFHPPGLPRGPSSYYISSWAFLLDV
jgi:hypothetical protein